MTDKSTFMQRKLAPVPEEKKFDPRVNEFLRDFVATGEAVQEQRREIERQGIEIEKLRARNGYADTEMKRIARGRDQFQAQYCELKIALEVVVTSAVAACDNAKAATARAKKTCIMAAEEAKNSCLIAADEACRAAEDACQSVIDQARAALAQVKAELIKAGVEPPGEVAELTEQEEKEAREFGFRYAPRKDEGAA